MTPQSLKEKSLAKQRYDVLKVLGNGKLTKKLKVSRTASARRHASKSKKPAAKSSCFPVARP